MSQTLKLQRVANVLFELTMELSAAKPLKPCKPLATANCLQAEQHFPTTYLLDEELFMRTRCSPGLTDCHIKPNKNKLPVGLLHQLATTLTNKKLIIQCSPRSHYKLLNAFFTTKCCCNWCVNNFFRLVYLLSQRNSRNKCFALAHLTSHFTAQYYHNNFKNPQNTFV